MSPPNVPTNRELVADRFNAWIAEKEKESEYA